MEGAVAIFSRFQHQMTAVFLAALVFGAIATYLHPWLPVTVVIAYFVVGLLLNRNQKNSDPFADSLYYLGFLLTLVALLHATQQDNASEAIIENLGTGLSTTLAGLAFRVLILQFRETVSDQEEEAQVVLETQVASLIQAFSELRVNIQNFHISFLNEANSLTEGVSHATKAVANSAAEIGEMPAVLADAFAAATQRFAEKIDAVDVPVSLIHSKIDQAFVPLNDSLRLVAKEFAATGNAISLGLNRSSTSVTQGIQSIGVDLVGARNELNAWIAEIGTVPSVVKEGISESVQELRNRIRRINFDVLNQRQNDLVTQLEATSRAFRQAEETAIGLDGAVSGVKMSAKYIDEALASAVASSKAIEKVVDQISDAAPMTGDFSKQVAQLATLDIEQIKNRQQELSERLDSITDSLKKASDGLNAMVAALAPAQQRLLIIEKTLANSAQASVGIVNAAAQLRNNVLVQRPTATFPTTNPLAPAPERAPNSGSEARTTIEPNKPPPANLNSPQLPLDSKTFTTLMAWIKGKR